MMATYFGEIIEPSSRAFFEDCSDDESNAKLSPKLSWKTSEEESLKGLHTFIILHGQLTLAFAEAYLIDQAHNIVGEVSVDSEDDEQISPVVKPSYIIKQGDTLFLFTQTAFPVELTNGLIELISPILERAKKVVIFTSDHLANYKSSSLVNSEANAVVFSLKTRSFSEATLRPVLDEANIVTGVPAGALTWCEIFDIPAVLYVSYSVSPNLDSVTGEPLQGLLSCRNKAPDLKRRWIYGGAGKVVGALPNMYY